jgi:hypothetical protein
VPVVLAALLIIVLVLFASVVLIPIALIQRYRAGTMRRRARVWLVTINVIGIGLSTVIFLLSAALTNIWIPDALSYAAMGVAIGFALGIVGLALTRWEPVPGGVIYTPNKWLVLTITVGVAGRIGYGLWRSWHAWESFSASTEWVASAGVAGSLAAGAVILGYYLAYWFGVRRRALKATRVGFRT